MQSDDTSPATKQDIHMIMEVMGQLMQKIQHTDDSLIDMEERITERVTESVYNKVMPEVQLLIETLRHDVIDAKKDQVARHQGWLQNHDARITVLESAVHA